MEGSSYYEDIRLQYHSKALETWIVGHRGLFVLCRELHRSLIILEVAAVRKDDVAVGRQFARLASITRACSVAFKFSAEMSTEEYDAIVVKSMIAADPRFTGMWSRDHSGMLRQLRKTFEHVVGFEAERAHITTVTRAMIQQHVRVCEQFAKGRPSLNTVAKSGMAVNSDDGYMKLRDVFAPRHLGFIDPNPQQEQAKQLTAAE
jgi:hypothetical protein